MWEKRPGEDVVEEEEDEGMWWDGGDLEEAEVECDFEEK